MGSLRKDSEAENQEERFEEEEELGGVEVDEYDTSIVQYSDEGGNDEGQFILGTVSRFGSAIRLNNRLMF